MSSRKQKTIQKDIRFSGVGLHTGCEVNVVLKPAPANAGICFKRTDLSSQPLIPAHVKYLSKRTDVPRCTALEKDNAVIYTIEHLMSVLYGLGIDNLIVELDAHEIPGGDGSGNEFVNYILEAGILEQEARTTYFSMTKPLVVSDKGATIFVMPSDKFEVSYTLDYNHPFLRSQYVHYEINEEIFKREIAPCRTFCVEQEVKELRQQGLGKGANYQNTLVVSEKGIIDNEALFPDEFARHKVLDLIGDLSLLGVPLRGHVFAVKSGHALNMMLLKKIAQEKETYERHIVYEPVDIGNKKELDIHDIMMILPHRYPFLLVDRVIELDPGKRLKAIKNVTINDNYFQGHFPSRAIMPGVLMVEAMAQAAGIAVLTGDEHKGKLAFFMAIDKAKFRKVVIPGDQLVMEVDVVKARSRFYQVRGEARVQNEIAAQAEMTFSFTDASFLIP